MAKKKDKALKSLEKEVTKLRKQNEKLAEALEKTREDQAAAHRELRSLLEERLPTKEAGPGDQEDNPPDGDYAPESTEAAARRAGELGVDLTGVQGTGSEGRILVTDVEAAAETE